MGSKKYTLQPLVDVRREKADSAKRELSVKIRERESKEEELQSARQRTLEHASAVQDEKSKERAELEHGHLRAVDLFRQNAWEMEQERQAEALAYAEKRTAAELTEAHGAEEEARDVTATRLGELEAVERDRQRFVERERKAALAKEEEAAEEAWRPRSD